jgi:hypothetical protein
MSKHTTTRFYLAAWLVWLIAILAFLIDRRETGVTGLLNITDPYVGGLVAIIDVLVIVMFMLWLGALARLARQQDRGWFLALLILQLVGLGAVGMAAYAIAGPVDIDLSKPGINS